MSVIILDFYILAALVLIAKGFLLVMHTVAAVKTVKMNSRMTEIFAMHYK